MANCSDPVKEAERRRKIGDANRGHVCKDETRDKMSAVRKGRPHSKEHAENIGKALKGRAITPEWREKLRQARLGKKASPETREKMSASHSGKNNHFYGREHDLATRQRIAEKAIGREPSYESLTKNTESHIGGFWYGNVRYPNRVVCIKWEDVNERVHAFFNDTCVVCGKTKTGGLAPAGHHVFYETKACCWYDAEDGIYYTNLNAKDHPEKDYCIGENPNYFVLLCQSCHGKSNGTFANRKKWADMLKKLVDEKYDGKCFYTKEELKTLKELGRL